MLGVIGGVVRVVQVDTVRIGAVLGVDCILVQNGSVDDGDGVGGLGVCLAAGGVLAGGIHGVGQVE